LIDDDNDDDDDDAADDEVQLGCRFTFECRLESDAAQPRIEWFKEGREVARDKQSYKDGLCQLMIDATGPDDTAKYTCRATTEAGTTDTSATLRVKGACLIQIQPVSR